MSDEAAWAAQEKRNEEAERRHLEWIDEQIGGRIAREKARKNDRADAKPRLELVPFEIVDAIAEVLTYGCKKYAPRSWQNLEDFEDRYAGALLRHISAWRQGEELDPESGLPHLAHAACNIAFLLWKAAPHNQDDS